MPWVGRLRRTMSWRERSHGLDEIQQGEPQVQKKYRVGSWRAYERGLRARGDVTVWFAEEALSTWTPPPTRRRGGQRRYSNLAILTALSLRMLFHLPLRQTEGFVASLLRLMDPGPERPGPHDALAAQQGRSGPHPEPSGRRTDSPDRRLDRAEDLRCRRVVFAQAPEGARARRLAEAAHRRGR